MNLIPALVLSTLTLIEICAGAIDDNVLVYTVASESTDGYQRFMRSADFYNIKVTTLGMGKPWKGGDMNYAGGGYKVNLLKEALKPLKDDADTIVMFTDSYDVIFVSTLNTIVEKFKSTHAKVLFGAENYCWPDESLKSEYPPLVWKGARFLNSGMFIGYAKNLYEILKTPIKDSDDDQLYYTKAYLNKEMRDAQNIRLDHTSVLFQNLNGAVPSVTLAFDADSGEAFLVNNDFKTKPVVVHGNGNSKLTLNNFGNYLAGAFDNGKCKACEEDVLTLDEDKLPTVLLAVFIENLTPFLEEFLKHIVEIDYPKANMHLLVHNKVEYHQELVASFYKQHSDQYKSAKLIGADDKFDELTARELAVARVELKEADYLFSVDSIAHIDHPLTLRQLLILNKSFIAPIINRPESVWSNFWGALNEQGFYARSSDYMDIVNNKLRGIWNVPFVTNIYLVKSAILPKLSYRLGETDPDMALCYNARKANIFMFATNVLNFGHLIDDEVFDTTTARPDFYNFFNNMYDWERRYIHPDYQKVVDGNVSAIEQPCTDVYRLPLGTERFCDDLVAIVERYGKWSDGSNTDKRLQGGYEAVPTRDIHMNQVGLERIWLHFLKVYVRPYQEKIFLGYFHDPPRSLMNFVVRYRPDEQPSLRPHHDSSTYTINIALNTANVDYEGGGCRFLRYNCSVKDTKKGYMLMHPGRLTHFHEGLLVTNGTRYIMISFVDP